MTAHELVPPAPTTLEQTGLAAEFVTQLVLKTLDARTELQATQVVEETGLELSVIEPILEALKLQHLCEIVASAGAALNQPRHQPARPVAAATAATATPPINRPRRETLTLSLIHISEPTRPY